MTAEQTPIPVSNMLHHHPLYALQGGWTRQHTGFMVLMFIPAKQLKCTEMWNSGLILRTLPGGKLRIPSWLIQISQCYVMDEYCSIKTEGQRPRLVQVRPNSFILNVAFGRRPGTQYSGHFKLLLSIALRSSSIMNFIRVAWDPNTDP
jgi:hypothetical protein